MRRNIAIAAGSAALVVSLAGCMGGADDKSASGGGDDNGGVALSAAQVMDKTAKNTANADTYRVKMDMDMAMKQGGKSHPVHMAGDGQYQVKPKLAFAMNMSDMNMGGKKMPGGMQMRLVGKAMYMKIPQLQKMTGKPWLKISYDQMSQKSGMSFDQIMKQAQQQADPASMTQMLTESKDVKKVGTEDVAGTSTTHYTGTVDVTQAMNKMDAKYRKKMSKQLKSLKNAKFDLWSDDQQLPRKVTMHGKIGGGTYKATQMFSDFGKPVHIAAPPAGQVGNMKDMAKGVGNPH